MKKTLLHTDNRVDPAAGADVGSRVVRSKGGVRKSRGAREQ